MEELDQNIIKAEEELKSLNEKRKELVDRISSLKQKKDLYAKEPDVKFLLNNENSINNHSSEKVKIDLFRSLFKGRVDVFPKRFENTKTGKSGYSPACDNEWIHGICEKPKIKCSDCQRQNFIPVTDKIIRNHLTGFKDNSRSNSYYVIGLYPLLQNDTCCFLAVDFDKLGWKQDVSAFFEVCHELNIPASLERSRSGNGGHIWIFFSEPVPASTARKLGSFIITQTMAKRPEINFDSYDRFFPSQDYMPKGGFGNLIALPLQKKARENGNSVFIDDQFVPYKDQWNYLGNVRLLSKLEAEELVRSAAISGMILGIKSVTNEECEEPWNIIPGKKSTLSFKTGELHDHLKIVLGNQIYIEKEGLPPSLINALIRLAAFQNPEFYKAQAMRLPTFNKPRIISCHDDYPKHIGLPRGCLEDVNNLLKSLSVKTDIIDYRYSGKNIEVNFFGELKEDQKLAVNTLIKNDIGILAATTAFGKTVAAIYIIAKRKVNTLILVHRQQLVDQWVYKLSTFLQIDPKEIGIIGGGKRRITGKIDVAIIQSLSRKHEVDEIISEYGQIIVDECHHVSAYSFELAVKQSKAKYFLGLSATVNRKDGHHPIVLMSLGPVRYSVNAKKFADESLIHHRVIIRKTDVHFNDLEQDNSYSVIHKLYSVIISDKERNSLIVEDVISSISGKRFPLVLTERREHMKQLYDLILPVVKNVFLLEAGIGKKRRSVVEEKMKNIPPNEPRVIISTGKYIGEGFDDPRLDTLFLTMPISWKGTIAQYAGRLHRAHHLKNEVIVYDYVDSNSRMFLKMFSKRIKGYRAIGYEVEDI
ncbi:MAG: DEAD/DEAH box helicase family protein [Ignavibacteriaceae bacterium]|nr:DEAD/DEAH box helicase family protein [Ignavibacteriaceae bacterium]